MTGGAGHADAAVLLERPGVARVLACLDRDGEEARLVGGAVRNHLMGLQVADIDICTTALPDVVIDRARAAGLHAVPTGYDHGTVTLIAEGVPHEVTTLRQDVDTDGRHAVVAFGRDFRADALRRDFTINALSMGRDGAIHDYVGGRDDIARRAIRFIGDADSRIREDYLRILRFFRFSAAYGDGGLDADGLNAVVRNRQGLAGLSRERVRQEMVKLIVAPRAAQVLAMMDVSAILADVLGARGDVPAFATLEEQEVCAGLAPEVTRRLAALAVRSPNDVARLRDLLRLTNREEARLLAMLPPLEAGLPEAELKEARYRRGEVAYIDALLLTAAVARSRDDLSAALGLPQRWTPPRFEITGADVMARGVPHGRAVGKILAETEARWIAAGMPEGRAEQEALLANPAE